MNLKSATDHWSSMMTSWGKHLTPGLKTVWAFLNFDLIENVLAPRRTIFVALDRESLSVVYGSRFLGKTKIIGFRKYAYDRKTQDGVNRKYIHQDGQFPKPEVLASTLELFVSEFNAGRANIIFCIPKAWTIHRTVEFPAAVEENIHTVMAYELDRLVSLNPENAYYDFKIVRQSGDVLKVAVAAARMDLLDSYLKPIEEKGLTVEKVTTALSVASGLLQHRFSGACFIFLEVYKDGYEAAGMHEGAILFAHKEQFHSDSEESKIKAISDEANSLIQEMNTQGLSPKVVLCSDEDHLEEVKDKVSGPVENILKSKTGIDYSAEAKDLDYLAAAGCLELTAPRIGRLNLLSKSKKTTSRPVLPVSLLLAGVALLFGVLCLIAPLVLEKIRISEIEQQIDSRKEEFRKIEPQKNELDNILYRIKTTNDFKNSAPPRILLLKELNKILPASCWVSQVTIDDQVMEIELHAKEDPSTIAALLAASSYFNNVKLEQPKSDIAEAEQKKGIYRLKMDIAVKMAAENQESDNEKK